LSNVVGGINVVGNKLDATDPQITAENAHGLTDRRYPELLADLASETIVNFPMPGYGSLSAVRRIDEDSVTTSFACKSASITAQVIEQFVPFHLKAVPA
jgi:hypothetical protein